MPIVKIDELPNTHGKKATVFREVMGQFVPGIENPNIPADNGTIWLVCGAGGSGKTNMLMNMFRKGGEYAKKFDEIYYFAPDVSASSLEKHPFAHHDKCYGELSLENLSEMYQELVGDKAAYLQDMAQWKRRNDYEDDDPDKPTEEPELKYHLCLIDDFADELKTKAIQAMMKRIIIKARHLTLFLIITAQDYLLIPKTLRKQMTYCTIYRPRNNEEWTTLRMENLPWGKEDSEKIYKHVFNAPYQHFDYNKKSNKMYKNFNELRITEI